MILHELVLGRPTSFTKGFPSMGISRDPHQDPISQNKKSLGGWAPVNNEHDNKLAGISNPNTPKARMHKYTKDIQETKEPYA